MAAHVLHVGVELIDERGDRKCCPVVTGLLHADRQIFAHQIDGEAEIEVAFAHGPPLIFKLPGLGSAFRDRVHDKFQVESGSLREVDRFRQPLKQASDHIRFGATVTVQPTSGPEKVYQIVGIDEADIVRGRISWTSPLARSLLGGKAGDIIEVNTPAGEHELEIIEVRYREIL